MPSECTELALGGAHAQHATAVLLTRLTHDPVRIFRSTFLLIIPTLRCMSTYRSIGKMSAVLPALHFDGTLSDS